MSSILTSTGSDLRQRILSSFLSGHIEAAAGLEPLRRVRAAPASPAYDVSG
jgi:hypothetical protein